MHLIIGTSGNPMQNIIRDLKRHTSKTLHIAIKQNSIESRRESLIWMMERAERKTETIVIFNYGNSTTDQ